MFIVEIDMVLEIFGKGMKEEKWFLNLFLFLCLFVENVNISSNKFFWLLSEWIGKNFNEYINRFCMENFKEMVLNFDN